MNDTTKRVIEAYRYLIFKDIVKNGSDFATKIGIHKSSLSKIINGQREFPSKYIADIVSKFNVSADYIFYGKQPIINKKMKQTS
jgi:transcriptional regulator with XRE-family HTH domain